MDPHTSKVLVVSTDPLMGALLGMLVELEGKAPVFDDGREAPQQAVERHRPELLLVDIEHRDGASDAFLARQRAAGLPVVLYGSERTRRRTRECAERHGLTWLVLPAERAEFAGALSG